MRGSSSHRGRPLAAQRPRTSRSGDVLLQPPLAGRAGEPAVGDHDRHLRPVDALVRADQRVQHPHADRGAAQRVLLVLALQDPPPPGGVGGQDVGALITAAADLFGPAAVAPHQVAHRELERLVPHPVEAAGPGQREPQSPLCLECDGPPDHPLADGHDGDGRAGEQQDQQDPPVRSTASSRLIRRAAPSSSRKAAPPPPPPPPRPRRAGCLRRAGGLRDPTRSPRSSPGIRRTHDTSRHARHNRRARKHTNSSVRPSARHARRALARGAPEWSTAA